MLGVTGGIAAYKAAELTRLLVKAGVGVDVVHDRRRARSSSRATTFQALSGRPVLTDLWALRRRTTPWGTSTLSRGADAIVVAPASADFLAKLAHGTADDLLSTLCLARECPLLVAPAMNRQMWANAATQRNVAQLAPTASRSSARTSGELACGENGEGRMLEAEEIFAAVVRFAQPKVLAGKRVLLTAGPTFEAIDPVRGITNSSSGKMGFALAQAAAEAGAEVTMVAGRRASPRRPASRASTCRARRRWPRRSLARDRRCDVFIAVAAVADYTPAKPSQRTRSRRTARPLTLTLKPTVDILATVAARPKPPFCVGFAAESHDVERRGRGEAPAQEAAADRRQPGAGRAGQRRQRGDAARRRGRASVAADGQAGAGATAGRRDRGAHCRA